VTIYDDGSTVTSTSTRSYTNLAPSLTAATTSELTWEFSGVALTWPTVYLAYTDFSRLYLAPESSTSVCSSTSSQLVLPAPTDFENLIYPASETPGPSLPPAALIDYLNAQPTIIAQLSGSTIGQSCDPIAGGIAAPLTSTVATEVVYTSTHVLAEETGTTDTVLAQKATTVVPPVVEVSSTTTAEAQTTSPVTTVTPSLSTAPTRTTTAPVRPTSAASSFSASIPTTSSLGSTSITPFLGAAHGRADMRFIGFEGWFVGVVGALGVI
jgi:hypothetical protein